MDIKGFGQVSVEVNKMVRDLRNKFADDPKVQDLADRVHQECRTFLKKAAFGSPSRVTDNLWQGRVDVDHT